MNQPLVSVLICNYNYRRYLGAAIESALGQTYPRTEVVVVDDGSTDGSRDLIETYAGRITCVLRERAAGHAAAVNSGLTRCRGELVAFLDSDDVFLPRKIERMVDLAERAPGATLYCHRLRTIDPSGQPRGRSWPSYQWTGEIQSRVRAAGGWWPRPMTSAIVVPRWFLDRIGPFPEGQGPGRMCWPDAYAGDLAPFLGEVHALSDALTHYRVHGRNAGRMSPRLRMDQYRFEIEQLKQALERLNISTDAIGIERHVGFARAAAAARPVPGLLHAMTLALRSPALDGRGRLQEVLGLLRETLRRS
jgi:glycosyltransferase involved in cell wall biosynthesis